MKLKPILLGFFGLGLLASCSQDEGPNWGTNNEETGNGKYVAVNIKLPRTPSSRATNDYYDDGTSNEYKVFNACLVVFKGTDEAKATFAAAYDLNKLEETPDNHDKDNGNEIDNVTTQFSRIVELKNLSYNPASTTENLYAYVMLNYKNIAKVTDNNGLEIGGKSWNNPIKPENTPVTQADDENIGDEETPSQASEATFKNLFLTTTNAPFVLGEGANAYNFFMCNAPLSSNPGEKSNPVSSNPGETSNPTDGKAQISTLVKLDKDNIKDKLEDAKNAAAAVINVERGVAKATLSFEEKATDGFATESEVKPESTSVKSIGFSYIGWALDVKEKSSFISRNVEGADWWSYNNPRANNYRFVGNKAIGHDNDKDLYRTYWCYDPNYDQDMNHTGYDFDIPQEGINLIEKTNPLYCYENTFDVDHQNYQNTTRAVLQVTLSFKGENNEDLDVKDFYVLDENESKIFTNFDEIRTYPDNVIINSFLVRDILDPLLKVEDKNTSVELTADEIKSLLNIRYTVSDDPKIEHDLDDNNVITVKSVSFNAIPDNLKDKFKDGVTELTFEGKTGELAALISDANAYKIEKYENCNSYYDIRFMHFAGTDSDSDLAPMENRDDQYLDTDAAYDGNANDYLGRWGMVRNNWYDINVSGFKKLGKPVIPDAHVTTSDDNNEIDKYLSFKINVLSWAKRVQSVEF